MKKSKFIVEAVVREYPANDMIVVEAHWRDANGLVKLDRSYTFGWNFPMKDRPLVKRLVKAVDAQKVFTNVHLGHDIDGKTYIVDDVLVRGRYANTQLKQLGF